MNFIELTIEQASERWPLIRKALSESVPPNVFQDEDFFRKNLDDIQSGAKVVWIGIEDEKDVLLAITTITNDIDRGNKNVTIYCLYGLDQNEATLIRSLRTGISVILGYASREGCRKVCAYTAFPKIVTLVKRLGFNTDWTFVSMEVPDELER